MGQIYYDMGILASNELIECSVSQLVDPLKPGKKVQELFDRALGKVLFIDEAYRLWTEQKAADEIVTLLTQEKYRGKLIVILAGYDHEIRAMLSTNRGLSSRFPKEIVFGPLSTQSCLEILHRYLQSHGLRNFDYLKRVETPEYTTATLLVDELAQFKSWGNARDIMTVGNNVVLEAHSVENGAATARILNEKLMDMLKQHKLRAGCPA